MGQGNACELWAQMRWYTREIRLRAEGYVWYNSRRRLLYFDFEHGPEAMCTYTIHTTCSWYNSRRWSLYFDFEHGLTAMCIGCHSNCMFMELSPQDGYDTFILRTGMMPCTKDTIHTVCSWYLCRGWLLYCNLKHGSMIACKG